MPTVGQTPKVLHLKWLKKGFIKMSSTYEVMARIDKLIPSVGWVETDHRQIWWFSEGYFQAVRE